MATTKKEISYGSSGSDVKELQTLLNNNGYKLDVDGQFGSKTQAAVIDYQKKNSLSVDGIVGKNTWGSLLGGSTTGSIAATTGKATSATKGSGSTTGTTNKVSSSTTTTTTPEFKYDDYKESDLVTQAKQMLDSQLAAKPGEYQSAYTDQINDILNKILNREDFSYDLNGDMLYQQYKDQYTTQGKQAMMDTMGKAAALTGGYGNSYAQSVGQQTYQGYLQQLNERVPELYQLALDQYNREGDDLYNQYALYTDRENTDYGRYRDTMSDWYTERDYLQNRYDTERDYDYGKWTDERGFAYQTHRDQISDTQWQTQFDEAMRQYNESMKYQKSRDTIADQQWQKEFDEATRQFNISAGISTGSGSTSTGSSTSSSSSKSSSKKTGGDYDNGGLRADDIKNMQQVLGVTVDGKWGANSKTAAGGLSAAEAWEKFKKGELPGQKKSETSEGSTYKKQPTGYEITTYKAAVAYLVKNGVPNDKASNILTESEWGSLKRAGSSRYDASSYDSYAEYLQDAMAHMRSQYGK